MLENEDEPSFMMAQHASTTSSSLDVDEKEGLIEKKTSEGF
jgi:hypothetical protein